MMGGAKHLREINEVAHSRTILSHQTTGGEKVYQKILGDDAFALVEFYRKNEVQEWNLTLTKYLTILKETKNTSYPNPITANDLMPNKLSSKLIHKSHGQTYREYLYYRYNALQISMISDLLKKTYARMDAAKAEILITYSANKTDISNSETYQLSPMEQFRMASRMLRKDMVELSQSSLFGGVPISHLDLLTAALETGLINDSLLNSALKIDDLWNPYVPTWKKISNYAFMVTGTAAIFLPTPFNIISSVALVLLNGQIGKKLAKPNPQDNPNVIF